MKFPFGELGVSNRISIPTTVAKSRINHKLIGKHCLSPGKDKVLKTTTSGKAVLPLKMH